MKLFHSTAAFILQVTMILVAGVSIATAQDPLFELPPPTGDLTFDTPNNQDNIEVLARGPIHEAFATATGHEAQPTFVVPRQPPEEIRELPPELTAKDASERPYSWIPGYWFWDEERNDFIWISGVWRVEPQGRKWMPGYWVEESDGWRRVTGFWSVAGTEEFNYVQRPPLSLENGPTSPQPSDNQFWVPGVWTQQPQNEIAVSDPWAVNTFDTGIHPPVNLEYQWRPGYWNEYRDDYVWVPDHYVSTPSGCVFVTGYWDYVLPARGELYAPIFCPEPVVTYQPTCPVQTSNLLIHMFVASNQSCYWFGDYYDVAYRDRGFYPLYDYRRASHRHDPLISYYNVFYSRRGLDCRRHLDNWNRYYTSNVSLRPPRTLSLQVNLNFGRHLGASRNVRPPQSLLVKSRPARAPYSVRSNSRAIQSSKAARAQIESIQRLARQRQKLEKQIAVANRKGNRGPAKGRPERVDPVKKGPAKGLSQRVPSVPIASARTPKSGAPRRPSSPDLPRVIRSQNDSNRRNFEKARSKEVARQQANERTNRRLAEQTRERQARERRAAEQRQARTEAKQLKSFNDNLRRQAEQRDKVARQNEKAASRSAADRINEARKRQQRMMNDLVVSQRRQQQENRRANRKVPAARTPQPSPRKPTVQKSALKSTPKSTRVSQRSVRRPQAPSPATRPSSRTTSAQSRKAPSAASRPTRKQPTRTKSARAPKAKRAKKSNKRSRR